MLSASSFAFCLSSSRRRSASARVCVTMDSASIRACCIIFAASRCNRSSSCFARSASSSDFRILSCRVSRACSSGRHANFANSPSSTRNVTIVQINNPGSGCTSGLSIANYLSITLTASLSLGCLSQRERHLPYQHDQQYKNLSQNCNAFEQEQRQVYRTGDPVGCRGLARDALGGRRGEPAHSQSSADYDHAQSQRGTEVVQEI